MMFLCNAFSLNMIETDKPATIYVEPWKPENIPVELCVSAIGHADTARVVSNILGYEVVTNRISLMLRPGEGTVLFVAQYKGPRLPEGATTLPEGATLDFLKVTIE